jgi:uncharacterized RDD family membrane protein YckC
MEPTAGQGLDRLETPERVDLVVDLAGVGSRALAQVIDLFLITVAWIVVVVLFMLLSPQLGVWSAVLVFAAAFLLFWFYFAVFETIWQGQTPGKRMLRLRVQKVGGYPIDWTEALLRNLLRPLDAFLGYGLGVMIMLVTERSQRIGDLVAGTVVVRESSGGLAELERIGYATPEVERTNPLELDTREYEVLHDFLARRGTIEPQAAARIEATLARTLRTKLERRGRLPAAWRSLTDEVFLLHLDAAVRGEAVGLGPLSEDAAPAGESG